MADFSTTQLIERHIAVATRCVQDAERTISDVANAKTSGKELGRKVLDATNQIMPVMSAIAELHPIAKAVVGVFKSITQLETDRLANDVRIMVVHHAMVVLHYLGSIPSTHVSPTKSLTIFSLRHLVEIKISESIYEALRGPLTRLEKSMHDFGNFAAWYYGARRIVRFFKAAELREQLQTYVTDFSSHKTEIHDIIRIQTAVTVNGIRSQMDNFGGSLEKILSTLGEDGKRESEAARIIESYGSVKDVIENETWLGEVAHKLGERVSHGAKASLHDGLHELLEKNMDPFHRKIEGAETRITASVESSREAIMRQLNEGVYELIKDEDIKTVWEAMKWPSSVKSRVFVNGMGLYPRTTTGLIFLVGPLAIYDYYRDKFRHHFRKNDKVFAHDFWTFHILSRVIYHSAIGDAIDADSSGFICVHEVNTFIKKCPPAWSLPEWIAFWARGWDDSNIGYHKRIQGRLCDIERTYRLHSPTKRAVMKNFVKLLSSFVHAIVSRYAEDDDDIFAKMVRDEIYAEHLGRLQLEYREHEEARLEKVLNEMVIDDEPSVIAIVGQPRIELSILPFLYVWLHRVHDLVHRMEKNDFPTAEDEDSLDELVTAMTFVMYVFNARMLDLSRSWRQQRMSVSVQIESFCGGIFSNWYEESQKPGNILAKLLIRTAGVDDDNCESDDEYKSDGPQPTKNEETHLTGDLDQKVNQLWSRLRRMEVMIESLAASTGRSMDTSASRNAEDFVSSGPESASKILGSCL